MVVYYHTAMNIFAVANGHCSEVMDKNGEPVNAHSMIGYKLAGGVAEIFSEPVPEQDIKVGHRLRFDLQGATLTTEPVLNVEQAPSLSLRPHPLPESSRA